MADIKIDENDFMYFMNNVHEYIKKTIDTIEDKTLVSSGEWVIKFIEEEKEIRNLRYEKELWFEGYKKIQNKDKAAANEMYQKYIIAKDKLDKLMKGKNGR